MLRVLPGVVDRSLFQDGDRQVVGRLVYLECGFLEAGESRVAFQRFGGAGVLLLHPGHGAGGCDIFEPLVFVDLLQRRKGG